MEGVEMGLISQAVQKSFGTLDSCKASFSHPLKIRYLLLHACEGLERDPGQCILWLEVLQKHGMPSQLLSQGSSELPRGGVNVSEDIDLGCEHSCTMQEPHLCAPTLKVIRQSRDTEVSEGKSVLLKV